MKKILIAFGGNALLRNGDPGTYESQLNRATEAFEKISYAIASNDVVITHGNGPQVGNILLQNENAKDVATPMPLHACGAMSQGIIGEILVNAYEKVRQRTGIMKEASVIVTRTLVSEKDPAFESPSKPIGPFYDRETADELLRKNKWKMVKIDNKGYRRVVPSPKPLDIVERNAIFHSLNDGFMPICTGGGGIPVIKSGTEYHGVDAVIDKDLASSLLATILEVDLFVILTDVEGVYRNYGTLEQEQIIEIEWEKFNEELDRDGFPSGSMGPKVSSAIDFVKKTGKVAIIGSLDKADLVLAEKSGTRIY